MAQSFYVNIVSSTGNIACDSCFRFTTSINGGQPPFTCQWTLSGNTFATATGDTATFCFNYIPNYNDTLVVLVTDLYQNQGYGFMSLGYSLFPIFGSQQDICMVGVDNLTGKNNIIWEQSGDTSIYSYNIYKETTTSGVYALLANVNRNNFSTYLDLTSNPAQVAARYQMTMVDHCGIESARGFTAKTIHLTVSAGLPPTWNLNWDNAEGLSIVKYRIWRGQTSSNMVLLDSIQSTLNSYTDLNPPNGAIYYSLEAVTSSNCNPSFRTSNSGQSNYGSSFSNTASNVPQGMNSISDHFTFSVSPNPFNEALSIRLNGMNEAEIIIYNVMGEKVFVTSANSDSIEISTSEFIPGIYFVNVRSGDQSITKKLVKVN